MTKEITATYELYPPHISFITSEPVPPSIEVTFDIDIPEHIWEKYKDNEEELLEWVINFILTPSLNRYSKTDNKFNFSEN